MHILLLTRLTDDQLTRLQEVLAERPGVLLSREQKTAREAGRPVTAIIGGPSPELIEPLHCLNWVQLRTDTLEGWEGCLKKLAARGVKVTRTKGSYVDTVPDHVLLLLLALARDLPALEEARRQRAWAGVETQPVRLRDCAAVLVGLGSIGAEVARRCLACGLRVLAVDPRPLDVPPGVECVVPPEELLDVLPEADFLVITVPATPATRGLIDATALARLKPTARLINAGRGCVVDTDALLAALEAGQLAGAALDVVEPSPLPEDHPLWSRPDVLLTCHTGQKGSQFARQQFEVILENVRRYLAGEELLHLVVPEHWL